MDFLKLAELLTGGFYSALSQFKSEFLTQQEQRDMVLTEKLTQILQNQQASQEAIAAIDEAVTNESAQVAEAVQTLTNATAQLTQTNAEQSEQIKQLLAQIEAGSVELEQANQLVDELFQKSTDQLAAQQEAASKISAIFNPPATEQPAE